MRKSEKHDELIIFADGGSRGNPGPSGIGVVIRSKDGDVVAEISKYIGSATNNVAEYLGVLYGLQEAVFRKAKKVTINVDSQLVARQLKGEYRVRDENIRKFFDVVINLFRFFEDVKIVEIPREKNEDADALVNKALNIEALL